MLRQKLVQLKRNKKGVTAVEFAFAAPILFSLLIGAFEIGHLMFANAILEGAVREAARRGVTGFAPCGLTREEYIAAVVQSQMIGFNDPDKRTVTYRVYENFNDVGRAEELTVDNGTPGVYDPGDEFVDENGNLEWDSDIGVAGLGSAGSVVVYDIAYNVDLLTSFFAKATGIPSSIQLSARAAVRNEPIPVNPNGSPIDQCDI